MAGRGAPTHDSPYDDLDVDPYGKRAARYYEQAFRFHIPAEAMRDGRIAVGPDDVRHGGEVVFFVGISKEVPNRIVLDLDTSQLPTPPE